MYKEIEWDFTSSIVRILTEGRVDTWTHCGNFSQAPTGEPYLSVLSQGIKAEGGPVEYYDSAQKAVDAWLLTLKYLVKCAIPGSMLYWRRMPGLAVDKNGYYVSSRFLITNSPPIQSADYNEMLKAEV